MNICQWSKIGFFFQLFDRSRLAFCLSLFDNWLQIKWRQKWICLGQNFNQYSPLIFFFLTSRKDMLRWSVYEHLSFVSIASRYIDRLSSFSFSFSFSLFTSNWWTRMRHFRRQFSQGFPSNSHVCMLTWTNDLRFQTIIGLIWWSHIRKRRKRNFDEMKRADK